jgi:hypothetical protein
MVRFFKQTNTYSSSIEASAAFLLRIAYSCWGVTHPFWNANLGAVVDWPLWRRIVGRIMPIIEITINSHTGQSGRVRVFRVILFGYGISYITKGDPGNTNSVGLQIGWRCNI